MDVLVSGAAAALVMKAENEAYKRWAHQANASDKAPRTRARFLALPDVHERITAVADEMVQSRA